MSDQKVSLPLASLFALGLGALPAATLVAMPTTASASTTMQSSKNGMEGGCSRSMSKTMSEGGCSRTMAPEGHCVSAAAIKAHGGNCGKSYMEKHPQMAMPQDH
ncbi:hypothetical protein [Acidithiobacillus sp.]|uniref:hypothetical protein n=1 Tax=Acidithiobacillus sp. TaxID=1872118 RepID=UPI0025C2AF7A|nr:hypothetical protein [Acidithiobacillus sp.]